MLRGGSTDRDYLSPIDHELHRNRSDKRGQQSPLLAGPFQFDEFRAAMSGKAFDNA